MWRFVVFVQEKAVVVVSRYRKLSALSMSVSGGRMRHSVELCYPVKGRWARRRFTFPGSYLRESDQRIDSNKRFCASLFLGGGGALSHSCENRLLTSSCLSVCLSSLNNSVPTGRIFMKFYVWRIFLKPSSSFINPLNTELNPICQ